MTILFCQPTLEFTGSERSLFDLIEGLRAATPHRMILLAGADGPMRREFERIVSSVTVVDAPKLSRRRGLLPRYLRSYATVARALRRECRAHDVSLVYVNTSMFPQAVAATIGLGWPCVVHVHEVASTYPRGYYRTVTGLAARVARRIVCPSRFVLESAGVGASATFRRKAVVVPNASPFDVGPIERALGTPLRILSVIPVTARKGIEDLVACTEHLAASPGMPPFHVDIVGPIADPVVHARVMVRLSAAGLTESFSFHGTVDDVTPFYRAAHVLVHPSRSESFGRTVVEAASFSLPAVVVRTGGTPETLEDGRAGYLVAAGDATEMAERVRDVVLDPGRYRTMSQAAYARYRRDFTRDGMIARLREALRDVGL